MSCMLDNNVSRKTKKQGKGMDIFQTLADQTRRNILDSLRREETLSIKQIAQLYPDLSRQGITKHLDLLVKAGLLQTQRLGRERLHRLNAKPLKELDDWLTPYAKFWDERLESLAAHLGENDK